MSTATEPDVRALLARVQKGLDAKRASTGVALFVPDDGYRHEDGLLVVLAAPAKSGIRAFDYVRVLGDVEDELRAEGIDNVVLVPHLE